MDTVVAGVALAYFWTAQQKRQAGGGQHIIQDAIFGRTITVNVDEDTYNSGVRTQIATEIGLQNGSDVHLFRRVDNETFVYVQPSELFESGTEHLFVQIDLEKSFGYTHGHNQQFVDFSGQRTQPEKVQLDGYDLTVDGFDHNNFLQSMPNKGFPYKKDQTLENSSTFVKKIESRYGGQEIDEGRSENPNVYLTRLKRVSDRWVIHGTVEYFMKLKIPEPFSFLPSSQDDFNNEWIIMNNVQWKDTWSTSVQIKKKDVFLYDGLYVLQSSVKQGDFPQYIGVNDELQIFESQTHMTPTATIKLRNEANGRAQITFQLKRG